MGSKITDLFDKEPISLADLKDKILVVDTYNQLYMFLSSIRQPDGTPLMDTKGRVTSHLSGLFSRFTKLMKEGIKFIFVFDGKPPALKLEERKRRRELKAEAKVQYTAAKEAKDITSMKKYAQRTSELTQEMIEEAKKLIAALGCPIVQAAEEGEAQAAAIVKKGEAYAVLSQDADALMFGAPYVIRNLTITQRRKKTGSYAWQKIEPERISLATNLNKLGVDADQLIYLALLMGTDYNVGGIKGIGPKKALTLLKEQGNHPETLFKTAKWDEHFSFSWKEPYHIIKEAKTTAEYDLTFKDIQVEDLKKLLIDEHDFSEERVLTTIKTLQDAKPKEQTLNKWF